MSFLRQQGDHNPASWPFPSDMESMAHQSIKWGREGEGGREFFHKKPGQNLSPHRQPFKEPMWEEAAHKAVNTLKAEPQQLSGVPNKAEEMPSNVCLRTVPNYFQLASSSLSRRPLPATSNLSPASRRQVSTENSLLTGTSEGWPAASSVVYYSQPVVAFEVGYKRETTIHGGGGSSVFFSPLRKHNLRSSEAQNLHLADLIDWFRFTGCSILNSMQCTWVPELAPLDCTSPLPYT